VVALCDKDKIVAVSKGSCRGLIAFKAKGKYGFGYDPLFIVPKYKKTFAQLGPEIKNRLSHRAKALKKIKPIILKYLRREDL
jgi:XTP/dITP diphosphohydrolase